MDKEFILEYYKREHPELDAGAPYIGWVLDDGFDDMLLYARTDEDVQPDGVYQMSGNQISVRTLGLDMPFEEIGKQLDVIAEMHFG